jgi:hypothetical protein
MDNISMISSIDLPRRDIQLPLEFSDKSEIKKLHYLHVKNLGPDSPSSKSSKYGIFSHHGNTPHGIRLALEHAMSTRNLR